MTAVADQVIPAAAPAAPAPTFGAPGAPKTTVADAGAPAPAVVPVGAVKAADPAPAAPATDGPRSLLAGEAPKAPAAPAAVVPAPAADYKLALPEKSALNADDLKGISEWAKAEGLTEKQAQAALTREDKRVAGLRESISTGQQTEYNQLFTKFSDELKANKDFGGDKLPATIANAKRFLNTYASESFRNALAKTPFGSHPELIAMLAKAGATLREDTPPGQSTDPGPGDANLPPHQRIYPQYYK